MEIADVKKSNNKKKTKQHIYHCWLIPALHQYWGGQGKQSCRLAPPGELLKVFAGQISASTAPAGQKEPGRKQLTEENNS